jgi:hypothetical protein
MIYVPSGNSETVGIPGLKSYVGYATSVTTGPQVARSEVT